MSSNERNEDIVLSIRQHCLAFINAYNFKPTVITPTSRLSLPQDTANVL